jgi:hypothetical protein
MKKILISIPYAPYSKIEPELVKWLLRMITHYNFINPGKFNIGLDLVEGKPIDAVRNKCINKFLVSDYDYIMTIDDDIVPPDNCIEELMSHEKNVIGAVCFSFQYDAPFPVVLDKVDGGYKQSLHLHGGKRLITCAATGAACMIIKKDVLLKLKEYLKDRDGRTMFYETKFRPDGEGSTGQDFTFCDNLIESGNEIFIDTAIVCQHYVSRLDLKKINDLLIKEIDKLKNKAA